MGEGARYRKAGECVSRTIAGETILVPVSSATGEVDSIFNLNEVGAFIWSLLDGKTEDGEIVDAVAAEFDVNPGLAGADVRRFLEELETAGMIERCREDI
jgi:methyltransferase-like protein